MEGILVGNVMFSDGVVRFVQFTRDVDGDPLEIDLEIDGKRVRPDEWEYVREFQMQRGRPPSVIKSWWQKVKSEAA